MTAPGSSRSIYALELVLSAHQSHTMNMPTCGGGCIMVSEEYKRIFETTWNLVALSYSSGYCVSERGLQAMFYSELSRLLPEKVIVEPTWTIIGKTKVPDLVTVREQEITNIFELKFVPHNYPDLKTDISKLLSYGQSTKDQTPVCIHPDTGQWTAENYSISKSCERHFIAVAQYDAAAVHWRSIFEEVPELKNSEVSINHWYGRIGGNKANKDSWGIDFWPQDKT